jgi:hypothetical protein
MFSFARYIDVFGHLHRGNGTIINDCPDEIIFYTRSNVLFTLSVSNHTQYSHQSAYAVVFYTINEVIGY